MPSDCWRRQRQPSMGRSSWHGQDWRFRFHERPTASYTIGHWTDRDAITGCTVVLFDRLVPAAFEARGGAPGTRETDLLRPSASVRSVDAIVLSGGSAPGSERGRWRRAISTGAATRFPDRGGTNSDRSGSHHLRSGGGVAGFPEPEERICRLPSRRSILTRSNVVPSGPELEPGLDLSIGRAQPDKVDLERRRSPARGHCIGLYGCQRGRRGRSPPMLDLDIRGMLS